MLVLDVGLTDAMSGVDSSHIDDGPQFRKTTPAIIYPEITMGLLTSLLLLQASSYFQLLKTRFLSRMAQLLRFSPKPT